MAAEKSFLLVVDNDQDFLNSLIPSGTGTIPLCLGIREAQKRVLKPEGFAGAYINPNVGAPAWKGLLQTTQTHFGDKPIYLLCDSIAALMGVNLKELGISR